ncbi:hypothetical protein H0X10_03995 [Candidatus Saccharibacteria bacterium]|nr:hypothetical protein [Candidatus Saccharibacteria bacterium]
MSNLESFIHFEGPTPERPYFPYPVAAEKGLAPDPDTVKFPEPTSPGVEIASGRMPYSKQAGLFPLGEHEFGVYDLALGRLEGNRLVIAPASKDRVSHNGEIVGEGLIILTEEAKGRVRIAALALDVDAHPWEIVGLQRENKIYQHSGKIALAMVGWELPVFEIKDIDTRNGTMTTLPYQRVF